MTSKPFTSRPLNKLICLLIFLVTLTAAFDQEVEKKKKSRFQFFRTFISNIQNGDNRMFEAIVRPMEFRQPIVSIPAEGRYGLGFYGWKSYNPYNFDPNLITYADTT